MLTFRRGEGGKEEERKKEEEEREKLIHMIVLWPWFSSSPNHPACGPLMAALSMGTMDNVPVKQF